MITFYQTKKQVYHPGRTNGIQWIISFAENNCDDWGEVTTAVVRQKLSREWGISRMEVEYLKEIYTRTSFLGRRQMSGSGRLKVGIWHKNTCNAQENKWDWCRVKKELGMFKGERNEEIKPGTAWHHSESLIRSRVGDALWGFRIQQAVTSKDELVGTI